jgi:hypothetical protein
MDKGCKRLIAVSALLMSGSASAVMVTQNGTDVSFTYDDASLFGLGSVVGNSLFFTPPNFRAESANGAGAITANENLIIDVAVLTNGYTISEMAMTENGDYVWNGAGASVTASGRLGVVSQTKTCGAFACNDADIFNVTGLADTGGAGAAWSGDASVDFADTAGWDTDTLLTVSFQNDLSATTLANGELAWIQKKFGAIGLVINPVPVPAAVWLFGSGLLGLVAVSRRKAS